MALIDNTGKLIPANSDATQPNGTDPYGIFANNMANMLQQAQAIGAKGNTDLTAQKGGLERGQAALGHPGTNNPLNFLYNMSSAGNLAGEQSQMSNIFQPGITNINDQISLANQNLQNINTTANTELSAYEKMKPVWTLSPIPNADGEFYYYNTNTPPGQAPQTYAAGKIPTGVGGSPGGSPQSADHVGTLAQSNNPYGIKMSDTTAKLFSDLGATPGPQATDGGNFWSFPDSTSADKAARALLTSNLYANDSVDQALKQWSNYTGKCQYPGYNGSILQGTGIDPNTSVKSLTPGQIDVVLDKMKHAEAVGTTTQGTGSLLDQTAKLLAGGKSGLTFDDAFASINGLYGGKITKTQLVTAIQKYNPSYNINTAAGNAAGQQQNTVTYSTVKPQVEVANAIMNGDPNSGLESITAKFQKLPIMYRTGTVPGISAARAVANSTHSGLTEIQDYERALGDLKAKVNGVLSTGFSLGVVKGGETADTLFPDNMTEQGLQTAIKTVQGYEDQILQKLQTGGGAVSNNTNTGTTGVTSSGIKYTVIK